MTVPDDLLDKGCGRCGDVNCFGGCEDDDYREQWCLDFEGHKLKHDFCGHHQAAWCRVCDKHGCPECVGDPHCDDCGAALFEEAHNWDCMYAGEDE